MALSLAWVFVLLAAGAASADLGTLITIDEVPSLAQVESLLVNVWTQTCAGSIITNIHILSTASCFSGLLYTSENRRVILGASSRSREYGDVYTVGTATVHPSYGLLGQDSDIAVVRLENYIAFGHTVQQAQILGQGVDLPDYLPLRLVGWGNTAQGSQTVADDYLYSLSLYIRNNDACLEQYLVTEDPETVTENMICAGLLLSGRDFDSRDLGAPLIYDNVVVGLLSFGKVDAGDEYPVVATAVSSFTSWIVSTAV